MMDQTTFLYAVAIVLVFYLVWLLFKKNPEMRRFVITHLWESDSHYRSDIESIMRLTMMACEEASVPHMLYCGSVLGYVRHRRVIPGDEDGDMMVMGGDIKGLQKANWHKYGLYITMLSECCSGKMTVTTDMDQVTLFRVHHTSKSEPYVDIYIGDLSIGV